MPGLIVFRRRWSAGSDDLVVPGLILFSVHLIWLIILIVSVLLFDYDTTEYCVELLWLYKLVYIGIIFVSICTECGICIVSMRGSILDTGPRATIHYWLYIKLVVIIIDVVWLSLGTWWLVKFYMTCPVGKAREIMLSVIVCNWVFVLFILVTIWCTFDAAGRSWVKMKKYQRSMRESESRFNYKRSGSMNRNWRQRKVIRAYQDSWDHRCRLLFCCMGSSERNRNSFADIAKLLSDFFRELDVVPSDVVAGLVLLRKFQKIERQSIVRQRKNGTYEFLSGVPITERTQFLKLNDSKDYDHFQTVIHYMHYALGAYGWPMFLMTHSYTGLCQLCSQFRCCLSCCRQKEIPEIVEDNCCYCNYAALKRMVNIGDVEVIYTTFHVDVGETPFFVAIDYTKQKIVVSIRGTLSMKDVLTDLNAEGDVLPLDPPRDDWLGHKGMVQAAVYIRNKLQEDNLIQRALLHDPTRNTASFGLVLVGHSLGAGTAAILAVLLKQEHPSLQCFSYSPPGGLLSMPAVEYSKSFITSVVVGKDVVPRIGLHQMETLRADLINAIKRSVDPKWKTIACSMICCCCGPEPTSVVEMESHDSNVVVYEQQRTSARKTSTHPNDSSIALTLHNPLFPPGRIIHIVRHHPTADEHKYEQGWRHVLKSHEPVYQAIWVDNTDFDEVLISPAMIQDHMPDTVLAALNKVITTFGPRKPQRQTSNANSSITSDIMEDATSLDGGGVGANGGAGGGSLNHLQHRRAQSPTTGSNKICLETSFTSLQSPCDAPLTTPTLTGSSKASSAAGSLFGRSQLSSILQYDVCSMGDAPLSDAQTIVLADQSNAVHLNSKGKNVAFDISNSNSTSTVPPAPSPPQIGSISPPGAVPRSILHRQFTSGASTMHRKPTSLSFHGNRTNSDLCRKIDLVHDDWYGMAPLASPETLSEISSISSRASLVNNFASSIEKYLQRVTFGGAIEPFHLDSDEDTNLAVDGTEFGQSQMHTPTVMRRTPKIAGNLSQCADDWRSVDTYKRLGQVFITNARVPSASGSSSEQSFESASSFGKNAQLNDTLTPASMTTSTNASSQRNYENSKSVDNLDGSDGCDEILSAAKLTMSDSAILSDGCASRCPNCPCKFRSECCTQFDHTFCRVTRSIHQHNSSHIQPQTTTSSSGTYHSAQSSLTMLEPIVFISPNSTKNRVAKHDDAEYVLPHGVLESHFPVYPTVATDASSVCEQSALLPSSPRLTSTSSSSITPSTAHFPPPSMNSKFRLNIVRKRNGNEDRCFSRNESLPLLASLSVDTKTTSPSRHSKRNRKKVYPMASSFSSHTSSTASSSPTPPLPISSSSSSMASNKGESSV